MRIGVLGRTELLLQTARALAGAGHTIGVVGTSKAEDYYGVGVEDFARFAQETGADFFNTARINDREIVQRLRDANCDVCISLNWQTVAGPEACDAFPLGIYNVHAGDLPRFRGNAVINWAILLGERRVGLCLHRMIPNELDNGDILKKSFFDLTQDTYVGEVWNWILTETPKLAIAGFGSLADGSAKLEKQADDPALALRCYPRRPADDRIDWREPSWKIRRLIRASSRPYGGAFSMLEGKTKVSIWRADEFAHAGPFVAIPGQILDRHEGDPIVACGEGALRLTDVSLEGVRPASPSSGDESPSAETQPNYSKEAKETITKSLRNRLI
jgi:methionyl-tRNA formyltransferase